MIAPVLLMGRGLLPPRKAKHGVGSERQNTASVLVGVKVLNSRQQNARQLPLSGLAGNNPASCREKNTPTPELLSA
jgi:hypothetical protein